MSFQSVSTFHARNVSDPSIKVLQHLSHLVFFKKEINKKIFVNDFCIHSDDIFFGHKVMRANDEDLREEKQNDPLRHSLKREEKKISLMLNGRKIS